jgi:uncharacterized membrane protein YraQ (UPF0718 family)/copper chaperone CopZ
MKYISELGYEIWAMFLEMAPYMMLGLLFVGVLYVFITKEFVAKQIGGDNFWSVLKASLFGIPLPLCSCGVIPTTVFMRQSGASKGSTVSFLVSTPQTGIDSIIATYGMMGPVFAVFRPLAALVMGIAGGLGIRVADRKEKQKIIDPKSINFNVIDTEKAAVNGAGADSCGDSCSVDEEMPKDFRGKLRKAANYSFVEFLDDIAPQFIVGVIIAGVIAFLIPENYFAGLGLSDNIWGMLLMIVIGIPMYVCATASIPIAVSLMMKGFSPGVAFVFLAVGPATNAASIAVLAKTLGRQTIMIYLGLLAISSIVMGYLLDFIFNYFNFSITEQIHVHSHEDSIIPAPYSYIFAAVFGALLLASVYRLYFAKYFREKPKMDSIKKYNVEGMSCNHCVANVKKAIESVKGVESVDVRLDENSAYVKGGDSTAIAKAIDDVGYKAVLN